MSWLGIDVGGANLKVANTNGFATEQFFPLWQRPMELAGAVADLLSFAPQWDQLAVTMTGELADCYTSKAEGVAAITAAVLNAAEEKPVKMYTTRGSFVSADDLLDDCEKQGQLWQSVAAANWHAIATGVAKRFMPQGLLVDIGSTTTDLIPISDGQVASECVTDTDRLVARQLLYQGCDRTPVCAIADTLPYRGKQCGVAAELFATVGDAMLLLDKQPEQLERTDTADGKPRTKIFARQRMARMLCADLATFDQADGEAVSHEVVRLLQQQLSEAVRSVNGEDSVERVVLSGGGAWLAEEPIAKCLPSARVFSLADEIGAAESKCAGSEAVAFLAEREESHESTG